MSLRHNSEKLEAVNPINFLIVIFVEHEFTGGNRYHYSRDSTTLEKKVRHYQQGFKTSQTTSNADQLDLDAVKVSQIRTTSVITITRPSVCRLAKSDPTKVKQLSSSSKTLFIFRY